MVRQGTHDNMKTRLIDAGDRDEWLRMRRALWPESAVDTLEAEMVDILADQDNQAVFVTAKSTGNLGAFIEVSIHPHAIGCQTRNVGYIEGWYVDPDLRRSGVGQSLMAAAESWARAKGCREMASDSLFGIDLGIAAHQACGYTTTAKLVHFMKQL